MRPFPACVRSEEHTSELQSQSNLVCRLLLEKIVEMASAEDAQNAISQINGRELDGRRITVEVSNPQWPRTGGGRPGGGCRPGGGWRGPGGGGGRESGYAHRPSQPARW